MNWLRVAGSGSVMPRRFGLFMKAKRRAVLAVGIAVIASSVSVTAGNLPTATVFTRPDLTLADGLAYGGDPADVVQGSGTASLISHYSGPFGGSLTASAFADGRFDQFKLITDIAITEYGQGSFVDFYDVTIADKLPAPAGAQLRVDDVITILGPDPAYDLTFTWDITGMVASTSAEYVNSEWRIVMNAPGISSDRFLSYGSDNDTWTHTQILVLRGVPSNTPVSYFYYAFAFTWMNDCTYNFRKNYTCSTPATYSTSQRIDFGSTFAMTDFAILRTNGDRADGVVYSSENGLTFPGDVQAIPEPSTFYFFVLGSAMLAERMLRHSKRRISPAASDFPPSLTGMRTQNRCECAVPPATRQPTGNQ